MWKSGVPKKNYDVVGLVVVAMVWQRLITCKRRMELKNVAVIEKGFLGGGNTARNTTIIRSNYLRDEAAQLYELSLKLWEGLSKELNYNVMFSQREY